MRRAAWLARVPGIPAGPPVDLSVRSAQGEVVVTQDMMRAFAVLERATREGTAPEGAVMDSQGVTLLNATRVPRGMKTITIQY